MFLKESVWHLYDYGVHFWFDLCSLGGHSEICPFSLGRGSEIHFQAWVLDLQWSEPLGFLFRCYFHGVHNVHAFIISAAGV